MPSFSSHQIDLYSILVKIIAKTEFNVEDTSWKTSQLMFCGKKNTTTPAITSREPASLGKVNNSPKNRMETIMAIMIVPATTVGIATLAAIGLEEPMPLNK